MGLLYCDEHGLPLQYSPHERFMTCTVQGCDVVSFDGKSINSRLEYAMRSTLSAARVQIDSAYKVLVESDLFRTQLRGRVTPHLNYVRSSVYFLQLLRNKLRSYGWESSQSLIASLLVCDAVFGWPGDATMDLDSMKMRKHWYQAFRLCTSRFVFVSGGWQSREWLIADDAARIPLVDGQGRRILVVFSVFGMRVLSEVMGDGSCGSGTWVWSYPPEGSVPDFGAILDNRIAANAATWRREVRLALPEQFYAQESYCVTSRAGSVLVPSVVQTMRGRVFVVPEAGPDGKWLYWVDGSPLKSAAVAYRDNLLCTLSATFKYDGFVSVRPVESKNEKQLLAILQNAVRVPSSRRSSVVRPAAVAGSTSRPVVSSRKFRLS